MSWTDDRGLFLQQRRLDAEQDRARRKMKATPSNLYIGCLDRYRRSYMAFEDHVYVGKVDVEVLGDKYFALHLGVEPEHHRKGICSALVNYAVFAELPRALVVEDEDLYRELGGMGACTNAGQAFFDAWRRKHGMVLPPWKWVDMRRVKREETHA